MELAGILALTENPVSGAAQKVLNANELQTAINMVKELPLADSVMDYILNIIMATHGGNRFIREGASPRAAQALVRGARARAFLEGRYNVSFEDVDSVVYPVLRHRLILSFDAISEGVNEDAVISQLLAGVKNEKSGD